MEAASGTGDCKRAQRDPDVAPPIVYAIFLALGIGTLLPFNVFVTERAFFEVRIKPEMCSWTAGQCGNLDLAHHRSLQVPTVNHPWHSSAVT